ncbi:MAG: aspartate aminotransferase family protein [Actinobacteria bacterium]|nr:MAG: aspartate aminotransferase family protein [Actinomycetota bacterium]
MIVVDLERLKARAAEIAEEETGKLLSTTPGSKQLYERATKSLPSGVSSNFQVGDPYPIYLQRGKGSSVWDVDGTEYRDFHGGFGVNIVGHAHPKIVEALTKAAQNAIHFAVTTPDTVALAEAICERFQLEQMRFVNSGTEATMDALRVARAATGRDKIIKMEGSYHGHHDSVLFSVVPEALWDTVIIVPFNDASAVGQALSDNEGEVAAVILEPVMMNIGIVEPNPGYLQALRDACEQHGAALIYDEVKCGGTIAYGGTTERYGVRPHLAAYAKAIGGGSTIGAFGGEARFMEWVGKGAAQQGTFNGNPLSSAAGLAALTQVLTKDAYDHLGKLGQMLAEGCSRAIAETGIPAHTVDLGAKGCVSYRAEKLTNYRDFLQTHPELYWASYPWMVNRGIFMTPGDEEQWTISVQHTEEDIRTYVDAFGEFCQALTG